MPDFIHEPDTVRRCCCRWLRHLHCAVLSLPPQPWRTSSGPQGWKRMFYLDPGALIGG